MGYSFKGNETFQDSTFLALSHFKGCGDSIGYSRSFARIINFLLKRTGAVLILTAVKHIFFLTLILALSITLVFGFKYYHSRR